MKIIIFTSLYYPNISGGAEQNTQMVAEEMTRRGFETVVVTTSDRDYLDEINGVKVYYLKTRNIYWGVNAKIQPKWKKPLWHLIDAYNFLMAKKVEEIIKAEQPGIAQTNTLSGFSVAVWAVLKKHNVPIIHILHDHYLMCLKTTMFSNSKNCTKQCLACRLLSLPKKEATKMVDYVGGVSNYILDKHLHYGYFSRAKFKKRLPNVYDVKIKGNKTRNKSTHTETLRFGFVGQISYGKGIEILLEEFSGLQEAELLIFGKGQTSEYEEQLKLRYASEQIRFMGFKKDLENIYSQFDVLIMPSLWNETAGRVIVEAYSFGIPVIVSNRGGIGEFVEDGSTGFIFNPDNPGELREAIIRFQKDKQLIAKFSERCMEKARDFAKEKSIMEYVRAINEITNW